jgi:hypothetical protein
VSRYVRGLPSIEISKWAPVIGRGVVLAIAIGYRTGAPVYGRLQ